MRFKGGCSEASDDGNRELEASSDIKEDSLLAIITRDLKRMRRIELEGEFSLGICGLLREFT